MNSLKRDGIEYNVGIFEPGGDCLGLGNNEEEAVRDAALWAERDGVAAPGDGESWIRSELEQVYSRGLHFTRQTNNE